MTNVQITTASAVLPAAAPNAPDSGPVAVDDGPAQSGPLTGEAHDAETPAHGSDRSGSPDQVEAARQAKDKAADRPEAASEKGSSKDSQTAPAKRKQRTRPRGRAAKLRQRFQRVVQAAGGQSPFAAIVRRLTEQTAQAEAQGQGAPPRRLKQVVLRAPAAAKTIAVAGKAAAKSEAHVPAQAKSQGPAQFQAVVQAAGKAAQGAAEAAPTAAKATAPAEPAPGKQPVTQVAAETPVATAQTQVPTEGGAREDPAAAPTPERPAGEASQPQPTFQQELKVAAQAQAQPPDQAGPATPRAAATARAPDGGQMNISVQTASPQAAQPAETVQAAGPELAQAVESGQPTPEARPNQPLSTPVADQIADSVRTAGLRFGRQIIVRLHPPELGHVRLTFHAEGPRVRGVVEVDSPRTLAELQREATALTGRLAEGGVELRRLDIQLTSQNANDRPDAMLQQGAEGQQDAPQRQDGGTDSQAAAATDEVAAQQAGEQPAGQVTEQSINVWI